MPKYYQLLISKDIFNSTIMRLAVLTNYGHLNILDFLLISSLLNFKEKLMVMIETSEFFFRCDTNSKHFQNMSSLRT